MKSHRNFFSKEKEAQPMNKNMLPINRDNDGKIHLHMYTTIFSDVRDNLLASNAMYANLLNDVKSCIEPYSTKENIVLEVYETSKVDEFVQDSVVIGFRKYINSCLYGINKQHISRFILFFSFFLAGIFLEGILYGLLDGKLTMWVFKSIEVLASLFI